MISCPLCFNKKIFPLRKEKGIIIYECLDCKLGFLDRWGQLLQRKLLPQYNLKEYLFVEKKLQKRFKKLASIILKFKNRGRLLDIGGDFGLFSSIILQTAKFDLEVVEPNLYPFFLRKDKKVIHKKNLSQFLKINKKKYDLILLMDVLEHLKNPVKSLKKIKKILKKDGFLVIQTPNYQSLMAKICLNWSWWMIEDHKYFFSPKSIKKLIKSLEFKLVFFKTYEDFYDFKKNLDGNFLFLSNFYLRRFVKGLFFLIFFPIYFLTRFFLWQFGYGGLIFIIAKNE